MSITFSIPKPATRTVTVSANWTRTYTQTLRAITENPKIEMNAVLAASPVKIGQVYTSNPLNDPLFPPEYLKKDLGSWVQSIRCDDANTEDGQNWHLTIDYGPIEPVEEEPISRTPEVAWNFTPIEEIFDQDFEGNPVINTAYDAFDPPLTGELQIATVTIRRNEDAFDYTLAADYEDARNSDTFLGFGAGYWKSKITGGPSVSVHLLDGSDATYWPVTYELSYHPKGWDRPVLNQGMRQLNTAKNAWEPITLHGQPISSPALLDHNGRALVPGGTPIYLEFQITKSLPFADLGFSGIDFGKGPIP